jgi:hypothetical protein
MHLNLPDYGIELIPAATNRWYDRATRSWVVTTVTKDGYQVGDATYVHSKREALADEARRQRELQEAN